MGSVRQVFGIDGGGTSARLRVETLEGALLFYGEGGSTNRNSTPLAEIEATLAGLFARARAEGGFDPNSCAGGFVGTAGVDRPADRAAFAELLRRAAGLPASTPLAAGNDAEPALAGALGSPEGILLIAGTGSIAYGRAPDGFAVRAGGYGHLLGDEGSAFWLAFQALVRGLRSREGRDLPTGLLEEGLAFFGLAEPADLIPFVYGGFEKARIAKFARKVTAARDRGDPLGAELCETGARELGALVASVARAVEGRLPAPRVALRGGLVEGDAAYRAAVSAAVAAAAPGVAVVEPAADAATGACILARSLAKRG